MPECSTTDGKSCVLTSATVNLQTNASLVLPQNGLIIDGSLVSTGATTITYRVSGNDSALPTLQISSCAGFNATLNFESESLAGINVDQLNNSLIMSFDSDVDSCGETGPDLKSATVCSGSTAYIAQADSSSRGLINVVFTPAPASSVNPCAGAPGFSSTGSPSGATGANGNDAAFVSSSGVIIGATVGGVVGVAVLAAVIVLAVPALRYRVFPFLKIRVQTQEIKHQSNHEDL